METNKAVDDVIDDDPRRTWRQAGKEGGFLRFWFLVGIEGGRNRNVVFVPVGYALLRPNKAVSVQKFPKEAGVLK